MSETDKASQSPSGPLQININVEGPYHEFSVALTEARKHAVLAAHALNGVDPSDQPLQQVFPFEYQVLEPPVPSSEQLASTRAWLFGHALADAIAALEEFLEKIALVHEISIADWSKGVRVKAGGVLLEVLGDMAGPKYQAVKKAKYIRNRLDELDKQFGFKLRWLAELESIIDLRNCLIHRSGVVQQIDCKKYGGSALRVSYREIAIVGVSPDGTRRRLRPGDFVKEATEVHLAFDEVAEVEFPLGRRIALDDEQFQQLIWTIHQMGHQLTQSCIQSVAALRPSEQSAT